MTLLCLLLSAICALVALTVWGWLTEGVLVDLHQDDQVGEGGMR